MGLLGFFSKLGISHIIDRCLRKNPTERYSSYRELEAELKRVAEKHDISLENAKFQERYARLVVGADNVFPLPPNGFSKKGFGLIEYDQIEPYLVEAENLIAVGNFQKARDILNQVYLPEMLNAKSQWGFMHSIGLSLGLCFTRTNNDDLNKAINIFEKLETANAKPAEFYVNFSLALLRKKSFLKAYQMCVQGLDLFPADLDILGNATIAAKNSENLEAAVKFGHQRIKLRRDVHSLEELAHGYLKFARVKEWKNLEEAINYGKVAFKLIQEALQINSEMPTLLLGKVDLFIFFGEFGEASEIVDFILKGKFSNFFGELAAIKFAEILEKTRSFERLIKFANEWIPVPSGEFKERIIFLQHKIWAERQMIGKLLQTGERVVIRQCLEYFVEKPPQRQDDDDFFLCQAKVFHWLGQPDRALSVATKIYEKDLSNFEAASTIIRFFVEEKRFQECEAIIKKMLLSFPCKAEAYDHASYVEELKGNIDISKKLKIRADELFKLDQKLRVI